MHWSSEEQINSFIANKRQLSNLVFIETDMTSVVKYHFRIYKINAFFFIFFFIINYFEIVSIQAFFGPKTTVSK